jgi:hypothetical protein
MATVVQPVGAHSRNRSARGTGGESEGTRDHPRRRRGGAGSARRRRRRGRVRHPLRALREPRPQPLLSHPRLPGRCDRRRPRGVRQRPAPPSQARGARARFRLVRVHLGAQRPEPARVRGSGRRRVAATSIETRAAKAARTWPAIPRPGRRRRRRRPSSPHRLRRPKPLRQPVRRAAATPRALRSPAVPNLRARRLPAPRLRARRLRAFPSTGRGRRSGHGRFRGSPCGARSPGTAAARSPAPRCCPRRARRCRSRDRRCGRRRSSRAGR